MPVKNIVNLINFGAENFLIRRSDRIHVNLVPRSYSVHLLMGTIYFSNYNLQLQQEICNDKTTKRNVSPVLDLG
jgi:hypothetical protein